MGDFRLERGEGGVDKTAMNAGQHTPANTLSNPPPLERGTKKRQASPP
jgi:hypothetical protein